METWRWVARARFRPDIVKRLEMRILADVMKVLRRLRARRGRELKVRFVMPRKLPEPISPNIIPSPPPNLHYCQLSPNPVMEKPKYVFNRVIKYM
jgi:hypothetical protein